MKLANPLEYPLAVLAGGILLVAGIRFGKLPVLVAVPMAIAVCVGGATVKRSLQPEKLILDDPALENELNGVLDSANTLAQSTATLRTEAIKLLTDPDQMELFAAVQFACDRTDELPSQIRQLAQKMQGQDSLLVVKGLERQLKEAIAKSPRSTGVAKEQLDKLIESLERNLELAQQGQDARQAQVVSLSRLISDQAGILLQLQNKLRTSNLHDNQQILELQSLSEDIKNIYANVNLLTT